MKMIIVILDFEKKILKDTISNSKLITYTQCIS